MEVCLGNQAFIITFIAYLILHNLLGGKSAILTAITLALGGKTSATVCIDDVMSLSLIVLTWVDMTATWKQSTNIYQRRNKVRNTFHIIVIEIPN